MLINGGGFHYKEEITEDLPDVVLATTALPAPEQVNNAPGLYRKAVTFGWWVAWWLGWGGWVTIVAM